MLGLVQTLTIYRTLEAQLFHLGLLVYALENIAVGLSLSSSLWMRWTDGPVVNCLRSGTFLSR